jgi:c-di-GMP-binding flagellar brake protein YcgR
MATPDPTRSDQPLADLDKLPSGSNQQPATAGEPTGGIEQRKHKRKAFRSTAQLRIASGEILHVHTLDISAGGVSIVAAMNPKLKMSCVVLLNLPTNPFEKTTIKVPAIVVNSIYNSSESGFRIGLMFANVAPESQEIVTRFVNT